jgi:hypothetical protein
MPSRRRIISAILLAAATLTTACTSPTAPSAPKHDDPLPRACGVYQGGATC